MHWFPYHILSPPQGDNYHYLYMSNIEKHYSEVEN